MIKKLLLPFILCLFVIIFYSLGRQIYDSLQSSYRLDQDSADVAKLQRENSQLKARLEEVKSVEFVEQQARDKLNLARAGETVIIIPHQEKILGSNQMEVKEEIPNWQGWLRLFF